jgi:hypothetical protein
LSRCLTTQTKSPKKEDNSWVNFSTKSKNLRTSRPRTKGLYSSKRSTSTKVSGEITREMEEEYSSGRVDPFTKDIGKTMSPMDTVD